MSDNPTPEDRPAASPLAEGGVNVLGGSWQEQDIVLRDLWMQNKTPQQISDVLGRSIPAIMTRAARLGLPRRSAPGRKPGAGASRRLPSPHDDNGLQETRRSTASAQRQQETQSESPSQASLRVCLMCLRKFESIGRHNRICAPCKGSSEYNQASTLPDVHLPHA